jgi:CheY-like chemotaxis protein
MVCDTGIGMSAESMEKIFNTFVQGSDDTSRKYGGTGLGLVITRKLVELYGSEIRVKSEPGKGSCFNFILRLTECQFSDSRIDQREEDHEMTPFSGQRILLVEDNDMNKLIATKFLEDWNLTVETADNGLEAIEKVTAKNFDLVLMDIQMPQMDGYQASAHIRAMGTEPYTSIPIIALTAAIRMDISAMVTQSGMNNFIAKPFNPVDLHMKLKTYLG